MKQLKNIALLLLTCLSSTFLITSCNDSSEQVKPDVEDITESVYASVIVEPEDFYQAYSVATGIIDSILVSEGDSIKVGDAILKIQNKAPELNVENARAQLQLARQNARGQQTVLNDLKARISDAQMKLENDSMNYMRQQRLWEKNIGSKAELERRELAYKNAKHNLEQLQNQLKRTRDELNTQLTQAENNYQAALTNADEFVLRSQIDGKIYDILKERGELVSPQQPLAAIGRADEFVLEMRVDEVDISDLSVGQKIILSLDAFPNEIYEAEVSKIFPLKDERSQTFRAQGKLIEKPEKLYPGLAGEANIIVAEKKNSLTIPRSFLLEGKRVITQGDTLDVETGIKSMEKIEIVSGIDSTTIITKPE
ncbi:efflux RND transporter periplasmic adaptor subunit [Halocola ammonii]